MKYLCSKNVVLLQVIIERIISLIIHNIISSAYSNTYNYSRVFSFYMYNQISEFTPHPPPPHKPWWLHDSENSTYSMCSLPTFYHTIIKIDIISPCTFDYLSNKILPYHTTPPGSHLDEACMSVMCVSY